MNGGKRIESQFQIYHIFNRGIDQRSIFEDSQNKYFFLKCIRKSLSIYAVDIYAYCLMDNHFHLLIHGELSEIAHFMRHIEGRFGAAYNSHHQRLGRVFQSAYKSRAVNSKRYLLGVLRYIHKNPENAGMNISIYSSPFVSLHEYLNPQSKNLIISKNAFELFSKDFTSPEEFIKFHKFQDVILYDDIEEDCCSQISAVEQIALSSIQKQFSINSWDEAKMNVLFRKPMILLLFHEFNFTQSHISRLLGVSFYQIRQVLHE
ncbi:hypothetical protein GPL15_12750 [Clostridium sp. MCC353]|uniref:transposase n=1 Tax=Clostridium sp. MCC353 TaxID=2592646 RepID=UPI001C0337E5|nr:transposase [Clostridium sp. MCC353]MBT9777374.1 hypothetical protein [Clostridium sp. MCC353]